MMKSTILNGFAHIEHTPTRLTEAETLQNSIDFDVLMQQRRSIRHFSDREIPLSVVENIIRTAASAPSGANRQPWTFCLISQPDLKTKIRLAAEKEERDSYEGRMSEEWLQDLAPLGTDWQKPFLETAPYLIVVFKRLFEYENQHKHNNYYVNESVGIACGFLIAAIHQAGLVTLTHTPSPMNFLQKILNRPDNERPFLLLPVGYAADEVFVPNIQRKNLDEVLVRYA